MVGMLIKINFTFKKFNFGAVQSILTDILGMSKVLARWVPMIRKGHIPAHMSHVSMTAATECGFEILPHPPYSPDMAPSDFYLFPKLKSQFRGTQYGNNEGIIEAVNEYFRDQEITFYFEGIRKPEQRWAKCIAFKEIIVKSNGQIFIP